MKKAPSLDDILAVISAASAGDMTRRVIVEESAGVNDVSTRLGRALNVLLDDLAARSRREAQSADRLRILADAAHQFSKATHEPELLLNLVALRLAEVVKDQCVVRLVSEDGRSLVPVAVRGTDEEATRLLREIYSEPLALDEQPIARRVHETGEPYASSSVREMSWMLSRHERMILKILSRRTSPESSTSSAQRWTKPASQRVKTRARKSGR
jgi:hypothetical protein